MLRRACSAGIRSELPIKVPLNYDKLINWPFKDVVQRYTWKDSILYALGLGFGSNPIDANELRFVYEDGLESFPTMPAVLGHPGPWMSDPETGIDMLKVLHGEQHLTIHKPLPAEGTIIGRNKVIEVVDKGADKGALISIERQLCDESTGDLYSTQIAIIFARANGGFGGPVTRSPKPHQLPDRPPDTTIDISTTAQMALLYRLSGDYNPLHADPDFALQAGFDTPILHGLCTFGYACRAVLNRACGGDPAALRKLQGQFSNPVFPGDMLIIRGWDEGERVILDVTTRERPGKPCLSNAYAVLR